MVLEWERSSPSTLHPVTLLVPSPGPLGTYREFQGLIEEPVALAVQVGIGAARFGHTNPGKAGFL